MWKRIKRFFKMIASLFVEDLEDSVPLERRLAYDRGERGEGLKKMISGASDVGEIAEILVQDLATARIELANIRAQAMHHIDNAKKAAAAGNTTTENSEYSLAAALADEMADAELDLQELEQMVEESLKDKQEAKEMVLHQAKELEKLARGDRRLVATARMSKMRTQRAALKQAMGELIPGDQDDLRTRAKDQVRRANARSKAHAEIVDALWDQKHAGKINRAVTSARGREILAGLENEAGYTSTEETTVVTSDDLAELAEKSAEAN